LYRHDLNAALSAISARTIVIVCDNDLYFRPEDNQIEIEHIPNGELRIYRSPWGHCVASPGNSPEFERFLDQAISELLP
jgi:homoserine O-acetyltransferase